MQTRKVLKQKSFDIDIYEVKVTVVAVASSDEVTRKAKRICKKYNLGADDINEGHCTGYTIFVTDDDQSLYAYLIYSMENLTINTITHETDHLRNYILDLKSIKEDDNKEASANLNGFINQQVFDFLIKNQLVKFK